MLEAGEAVFGVAAVRMYPLKLSNGTYTCAITGTPIPSNEYMAHNENGDSWISARMAALRLPPVFQPYVGYKDVT